MKCVARWCLVVVVAAATGGWVIPAFLAFDSLTTGIELELAGQKVLHSFPHFQFARECMLVASIWFFLVLATWVVALVYRIWLRHEPRNRADES